MERVEQIRRMRRVFFGRNSLVNRFKDRENPLELYSEYEFKSRFRFSKELVYYTLFPIVEKELLCVHGRQVPPILQLLVALRFYATGSFQTVISDTVKISQPSVHRIVKRVSKLIASIQRQYIKNPNAEEAEALREQFFELAGFPGIVGAIDCTHITIVSPGGVDAEVYRNRKGRFSLNVQAVCKPNLEFTNVVARWKGSVHDSRIFENSRLCTEIEEGIVPGNLIGDSGYALKSYLLVPYENPQGIPQRSYNKSHVKTRNPIERSFGVLKKRFPCLNIPLRTKLENTMPIIVSCFVLHNIGIQHGELWESEIDATIQEEQERYRGPVDENGSIVRSRITQQYFTAI